MAVLPAANLKDNEAQVPHQIMQLLSLIVDSKRSDNLFISVYESGSTDDTGRHGLHLRGTPLPVQPADCMSPVQVTGLRCCRSF